MHGKTPAEDEDANERSRGTSGAGGNRQEALDRKESNKSNYIIISIIGYYITVVA